VLFNRKKGLEQADKKMRPMEAFSRPGVIAAKRRSKSLLPHQNLKIKLYRKIKLLLTADLAVFFGIYHS
jgi:hypothetical protein